MIILFSLLFFSCGKDVTRMNRKNLIKKEDFVDILVEMHMIDAITNQPEYYRKYEDVDSIDLYGPIFQKYGYDKADFDSTWHNYSRRQDLYLEIYDQVMLELNYELDRLTELDTMETIQPELIRKPE